MQFKFVEHYLETGKAHEAALKAGYDPRGAASLAFVLLGDTRIIAALEVARKAIDDRGNSEKERS